jgi:DNA-binding NtrC family response regulator
MQVSDIEQGKPRGCVLIVDDLPNWREVLANILIEDGHTVYSAAEPSQALEILARAPIDVAILDLRLQDKDIYDVRGVRLLEDIRATSPETRVVMMTGFPSDGFLGKVNSVYNVDALWLKNPTEYRFDIEAFSQEIRALVSKSRQRKRQV